MTWLDNYKAHLDGIVASKSKAVAVTGSPQMSNAYALLASLRQLPGENVAASGASGGSGVSFSSTWNATKSGGLKLLDFLSRPANAVSSAAIAANADNKIHHETLQKIATFLPVVGTYAGELAKGDISTELSEAWKGLKGENKENSFADFARKKGINGPAAAAVGFAGDVAFDPLTYVGAGPFIKAGKAVKAARRGTAVGKQAAELALEKPTTRALTEFLQTGKAAPERSQANDLFEFIQRQKEVADSKNQLSKVADLEFAQGVPADWKTNVGADWRKTSGPVDNSIFERPKPTPKAEEFKFDFEKPKADADEVALMASRATHESVENILKAVPTRRYAPGTKIEPTFEKVEAPVTPKAKSAKTVSNARALAMKQHILSNPDYSISVTTKGGQPFKTKVSQLRSMAESDPAKAKMIDTMINQEALRLSKESPEYFSQKPHVKLTGRTGTSTASISVDDFQRLLETGEVPRPGKGQGQAEVRKFYEADKEAAPGQSPLDAFGLHSTDDLANLHLSNVVGARESIGNYLKRQGVKIKAVDPTAERSATEAKQIVQGAVQPATYRPLSPEAKKAWLETHKSILSESDLKKLAGTKVTASDVSAWTRAVDEVLNQVVPTAYENVDDLMKALDEGRVSAADLGDLQKLVGAKSPKGIKQGIQKLVSRTTELEKKVSEKRVSSVDVSQWETPLPPVKTAEEIVTKTVETGDASDLVDIKATLDAKQVKDVEAGLNHLIQREILDPQTAEKYGFVSRSGTKRTHSKMNQGLGRNLDEWNKYSQLSLVSGIIKFRTNEVTNTVKASGLRGVEARLARRQAMYNHVMPVMRTVDKILKEAGIPPMLGKNPRYSASLIDVLNAMPRDFVERHFFSNIREGEHIPPTFWNDSAEIVQDYAHGLTDFDTAINSVKDVLIAKQTTRSGKEISTGIRSQYYKIKNEKGLEHADLYALTVAREFMLTATPIQQRIEDNLASIVISDTNGAAKVSENAYKHLIELVSSPGFSSHDLMRVANDRDAIVDSVARAAGVESSRAKMLAKSDVEVKSASIIPPEVAATAHDAKVVANAQVNKKTAAIVNSLDNTEVAVKQVMDTAGESLADIGAGAERVLGWHVLKAFAPHLGNKDVRPLFLSRNSFGQTVARGYSAQLNKIAQQHAVEDINAAWRELQNGTRPAVGSTAAAHTELEKAVRMLFNDDDTYNMIKSSGLSPRHINSHMSKFGIHEKYRLTDDYMNDWKRWETDNPLDLLSRFQAAAMAAKTEVSIGADLSRRFGTKTPRPGMVRITPEKSRLGRFLDPDAYFPKDIAEQMSVLDQAMRQFNEPKSRGKAVAFYDSVLHAYKSGLTIYRPGHHIRNMVGDTWLSWMDGVNSPAVYKNALYVMKDNRGRYDDFDALQGLAYLGESNAKTNRVVANTVVNGKKVELTTGQVYQLAYNKGILPDYRTLEDINFGTAADEVNAFSRLRQPFKGKLHDTAASFSESRDHYVRLAHFIDRLNKSNGKSLDDIAEGAAQRVRKWHPDGSDLTNFESQVSRRLFLFYSWIRKAIPLVVESTVMKPGKVMVYPKALQAIAQANGIDVNSVSDPFPKDQLFPSWIRDSTEGPIWESNGNLFSISPGVPLNDVVNDYGTSPKSTLRGILGSTTPIAKIPVEIATAGQGAVAQDIRTGAPKRDLSDYVDQQIPGVNVVANLSNRSPSSLFTQNTGESTGMTPDQIAAANEKNTPGPDTLALLNWLTGLGVMNTTKPNYRRQAQIEAGRGGR